MIRFMLCCVLMYIVLCELAWLVFAFVLQNFESVLLCLCILCLRLCSRFHMAAKQIGVKKFELGLKLKQVENPEPMCLVVYKTTLRCLRSVHNQLGYISSVSFTL